MRAHLLVPIRLHERVHVAFEMHRDLKRDGVCEDPLCILAALEIAVALECQKTGVAVVEGRDLNTGVAGVVDFPSEGEACSGARVGCWRSLGVDEVAELRGERGKKLTERHFCDSVELCRREICQGW